MVKCQIVQAINIKSIISFFCVLKQAYFVLHLYTTFEFIHCNFDLTCVLEFIYFVFWFCYYLTEALLCLSFF